VTPLKGFLYETNAARGYYSSSELWLSVAAILTAGYMIFGLLLVGIPELSRGAVVIAVVSFGWGLFGFITGAATLRPILILPVLFYFVTVMSGFTMPVYPVEYIGQITTVWLGAISISFFLTNGVSVKIIIAGLFLVFVANVIAISLGYEGYQINVTGETLESLESADVQRSSGLAGQSNVLLILVFTLPFAMFLLERKVNMLVYLILVAACITTTILTGSRSGIALSLLFMVFGALFLLKSGIGKYLLIVAGLIGSIVAFQYFTNPHILSLISNSELGEIVVVDRTIQGLEGADESANVRESLVTESWQHYYKKPWTGYGPNQFSEVVGQGYYAHNNFVEIGINWGLVGQVSYYLCYLAIIIGMFKVNRIALLTPLLFLIIADQWFVLFLERPAVLLLCAMLAISVTPRPIRGRRRRRRSSGSGTMRYEDIRRQAEIDMATENAAANGQANTATR
jgi:O-antigen ligase